MWKLVAVFTAVALLSGAAAQGAGTAAPSNTSPPTISGGTHEGDTLTATSGSWSGSSPISFSYRWRRCNSRGGDCREIGGAKSQTYRLSSADIGHTIRVSVTAQNSSGSGNVLSGPTAGVAKGPQPVNTAPPVISGTPRDGQTLATTNGSWANSPTSFSYQWKRCDSRGGSCRDIGGNHSTYPIDRGDVGATIRVVVRANNRYGGTPAVSAPTAVVGGKPAVPGLVTPPAIAGTARDGQTLTATAGAWSNAPSRFSFRWLRCDSAGNNCTTTIGTAQTQLLGAGDVGHRIRVQVAATNQFGTSGFASSVPTAVVAAALPPGAIKLPSGETSLPIEMIALPQRLVISSVKFIPTRLRSRQAFVGRFRVIDTRGYVVRGAPVYAIGLPYPWLRAAPEAISGADGWATIQFFPTARMPIRRAALVLFVRARKPGDSLLAGVSTRRLVQLSIG